MMRRVRARDCKTPHAQNATCENCFICSQCKLVTYQKNRSVKKGILKCEDCKILGPSIVPEYAVQQTPQSDKKKQTQEELLVELTSLQEDYTQKCLNLEALIEFMNTEHSDATEYKKAKEKAFNDLQNRYRELEQSQASQQVEAKNAYEALQNRCNNGEHRNKKYQRDVSCIVFCLLLMSYCLLGVTLRCW